MRLFKSFTGALALSLIYSPVLLAQERGSAFQREGEVRAGPRSSNALTIRKIYQLPGADDVGFALTKDLDGAASEVLQRNSRFQVILNPKVGEALRANDKGYERVIANPEVHMRAARLAGADTTVTIEARHVGKNVQIRQDWRRSDGTLLFSEAETIPSTTSLNEQKQAVAKLTNAIIGRIPYKGTVTGRTGNTVTLDLNENQLAVGDRLQLARVVATKEHPLLKTLVNIDYITTGYAEVISTDNVLGFARILSQEPGEEIAPENKVTRIDPSGSSDAPRRRRHTDEEDDRWRRIDKLEKRTKDPLSDEAMEEQIGGDQLDRKARYGLLGARLLWGSISHTESLSGNSTDLSGKGFGGAFQGEVWITKNWIAALNYDFISADIAGKTNTSTSSKLTGTSWNRMNIYAGYRYIPDGGLENTFVTFGLGYESVGMNIPLDAANSLGKKSYAGPFMTVIGDIVVDSRNRVEGGLALQPFSSLGEVDYVTGATDGASVISAMGRWKWKWFDGLWLSAGIDYNVATGTFKNGKNISDKRFSISPGLTYMF